MRSSLLRGLIGFLIVMSALVGGMALAGICHESLTPHLPWLYMIWLWLCLIPFWWLGCKSLASHRIEHPAATYLVFLSFLLAVHILVERIGPGNPWLLPALLAASLAYSVISTGVRKVLS